MINKKATKNTYIYQVINLDGEFICKGLVKEVAEFLVTSPRNIEASCISGSVLFGEYKVTRISVSVVGNSYMTMLKDIEVNGIDKILDEVSTVLSNLQLEIQKFKKSKKVDSEMLDAFIDSSVMLDEFRLILNQETDLNITNNKLTDFKREKLKIKAKILENGVGKCQ